MKKIIYAIVFTVLSTSFSFSGFAQEDVVTPAKNFVPKWVSTMGYWVVESNIHTPRHNILYCYDNNNVLVYKETKDGTVINVKKRRTKMLLKKLVEQTVTAYVQKQKTAESEMMVKSLPNN